MVFHVIAVGRIRDANLRALCEDYAGRTSRYARLRVREVPSKARPSGGRGHVLREEGRALLKALPQDARLIAITRGGERCDSRVFADKLQEWRLSGRDLVFLIGGAYGLAEAVRERCELALSLSDLTFSHELSRLVLLEQIYRGNTILRGEPYHKGD